jgi:nucleoside-diphosphate-sugar epimerase
MRNVNIDGTAALLEAAKRAGVKHFFFISTLSVYGRERRSLFLRKKRWKPLTAYGKDKLMAESLCQKYNASGGLKVTIFRPAAIISPGTKDPAALACLYMALAMRKNSRACLYSRSARYQFLDIHDAVRALVLAAGSRSSGGKTYELASGEAPKREEELLALLEKTKLNFKIKKTGFARLCFYKMAAKLLGSSLFRGDHLNYLVGGKVTDCAEIKKDLGWRPSVGNVEILVEACRWYKEEKLKQSVSF